MMASVVDILAGSDVGKTFSMDSLNSIANLKFWLYAIFYLAIGLTISVGLCLVYGYHRDRQDLIGMIEDELKDIPKDNEIANLE